MWILRAIPGEDELLHISAVPTESWRVVFSVVSKCLLHLYPL